MMDMVIGRNSLLREGPLVEAILPEIDPALCNGCGECVAACQSHALALVAGKAVLVRPDLCQYDGGCEPVCPQGAIQLPYLIVFE
jgi:NAD-dependent dihydropyrimidine dehydrogenase PreA subunit